MDRAPTETQAAAEKREKAGKDKGKGKGKERAKSFVDVEDDDNDAEEEAEMGEAAERQYSPDWSSSGDEGEEKKKDAEEPALVVEEEEVVVVPVLKKRKPSKSTGRSLSLAVGSRGGGCTEKSSTIPGRPVRDDADVMESPQRHACFPCAARRVSSGMKEARRKRASQGRTRVTS